MVDNKREHQLLALLYKVEELILELNVIGKESEDYKTLNNIIVRLENHLKNQQDIL